MNKKILNFVVLLFCILTITGCERQTNNVISNEPITNEVKPLEIERVYTTRLFPDVINKDDYKNINFYSSSNTIEMKFNQEIMDDNYTLGFIAGGFYYPVKSEFDEANYVFYKYTVEKDKLVIRPLDYYHKFGSFEAIYIPDSIKSVNNTTLSKEHIFLLSMDKEVVSNYVENSNYDLNNEREFYSLSIRKYKNDGINLAYVNNMNTLFHSKSGNKTTSFKTFMGENVIIKDEVKDMYFVNMYIKMSDEPFVNKEFKMTKDGDYIAIEGYIKKNDLNIVPEPLDGNNCYLMKTSYYNDMAANEFSVELYMYYGNYNFQYLKIFNNISNIDKKDLYFLESISLCYWIRGWYSDIFAKSYFRSVSNLNSELPKLDKNAHMPEINWSEDDYKNYMKIYGAYCNCIIDKIRNYKTINEMNGFMGDLLYEINVQLVLQQLWIDWGYKNKLENESYMFEEIFNRLDLSDEQIIEIQNIFVEAQKYTDEQQKEFTAITEEAAKNMLFDNKLYGFSNDFNYVGGIRQFCNYFGEMIQKKYQYGESFDASSYEQMKEDAVVYYEEQKRLAEIGREEEEKREQEIIDSGSDISEVDEVLANFINLSEEEKSKISDLFNNATEGYDGITCIVEEKQRVKGKCQILLKVKIQSIRDEDSKLTVGNTYKVIYVNNITDAKSVIDVGDRLKISVSYYKNNIDVLYTDYFILY